MSNLKLYYNEQTDQLGIAEETWDYICLAKFVPFVRRLMLDGKLTVDYTDPVAYVEHPIAEERTSAWVEIGDL